MQKSYDRARELSELVLKQGLERAMPDGGVTSFDRNFIATTEFAKGFDPTGGLFVGGLQDNCRYYRTRGQQNWARKMLYGMSFNSTREQLSDLQYYAATIAAAIPGVGLSGRMGRVFSRIPTNRLTSRLARGTHRVREPTDEILRSLETSNHLRIRTITLDTPPTRSQLIRIAGIGKKFDRELNVMRHLNSPDPRSKLYMGGRRAIGPPSTS